MKSIEILEELKNGNMFTEHLGIEEYAEELCRRYARIFGEIINIKDYDTIVKKLELKEVI